MKSQQVIKLDDEITIRRADTIAEYRACQDAQRGAWGVSDESYIVPIATMVGANLHGGLVLGAFLPGGDAVAMSFAFLGRVAGRLCLYSQLTGVLPSYQSRGLGYQIKLLQREIVRSEGIERIAWAFDPLQAGNAHFNLAKLGASAGKYIENMYGQRTDALNVGVATDRLIAEWNTQDEPVIVSDDAASNLPRLIETVQGGHESTEIRPIELSRIGDGLSRGHDRVLLEIPKDIAVLRRERQRRPSDGVLWSPGLSSRVCSRISRSPFRQGRLVGPASGFLRA